MLAIIIVSALLYVFWVALKADSKLTSSSGYLAWLLHAVICFYSIFDENGWKLNIVNAVLLVSWVSVLVVFLFKLKSHWVKIPLVIFVLYVFAFLDIKSDFAYHGYIEFSWQLDLHITLSMLSYSIFVVATLFAISLMVYIVKLRNSEFDSKHSLLSIIDEEKKLFNLISLGWLLLSTSLLSGVLFVEDFMSQHLGHKVLFSLLAWLLFGIVILGRLTKGWRGEKLIWLTIIGMVLLATGYLGSKIVLEWII
jgi:ABC-type uncharacterized transport system permease subunit